MSVVPTIAVMVRRLGWFRWEAEARWSCGRRHKTTFIILDEWGRRRVVRPTRRSAVSAARARALQGLIEHQMSYGEPPFTWKEASR